MSLHVYTFFIIVVSVCVSSVLSINCYDEFDCMLLRVVPALAENTAGSDASVEAPK